MANFSPRLLGYELVKLFILPMQFLYPLIMIVHGGAENFLRPFLADDKLVKVVFQHSRCYPRRANNTGATEWALRGLASLINTSEGLVAKI